MHLAGLNGALAARILRTQHPQHSYDTSGQDSSTRCTKARVSDGLVVAGCGCNPAPLLFAPRSVSGSLAAGVVARTPNVRNCLITCLQGRSAVGANAHAAHPNAIHKVAVRVLAAGAWGEITIWYARRRGRWPSAPSARLFARLLGRRHLVTHVAPRRRDRFRL